MDTKSTSQLRRRHRKAGTSQSLKAWAREHAGDFARRWLERKRAQNRKRATKGQGPVRFDNFAVVGPKAIDRKALRR